MSRIQEFKNVLQHIEKSWECGEQAALLMITSVIGSAYRRPGAKMMMAMDGTMFGTLSGGCLESDLLGWTEKSIQERISKTVEYDLTENELWGLGIGCKGSQEILILPIESTDTFWEKVRELIHRDIQSTLILELPSGSRVIHVDDHNIWGDIDSLPSEVRNQAFLQVEGRTRAEVVEVDGRRFVIDTVRLDERLIVAGAGHDAVPVVELASKMGYSVTVIDPRETFNNTVRFPFAQHAVVEPEDVSPSMFTDNWWIIMNHNQNRDEASLKLAINSRPKFIGVLGPMSRTEEMLVKLGLTMTDGPIFSPVGLDFGAETIDEVALSIVSQLMSKRNNRNAAPLHGRAKIHVSNK